MSDKLKSLKLTWQASDGNPELKQQIEEELAIEINQNESYCRETVFHLSHIQNKAVSIEFIPTSKSFNQYGQYVTINLRLTEEEIEDLTNNLLPDGNKRTFGSLRATSIGQVLSHQQENELRTIGFNTNDILDITYV